MMSGQAEEAMLEIEMAHRLSPFVPYIGLNYMRFALGCLFLERHGEAVDWARQAIAKNGPWPAHAYLVSALAHLGRDDDARAARENLQRAHPGISLAFIAARLPITHRPYADYLLAGLRKAGLPDQPPTGESMQPVPGA